MTRVKICGCRSVEDALTAKDAGADFIGLMFAPASRRRLAIEEGQAIVEAVGTPLRELEQDEPPPLRRGAEGDAVAWFTHGAQALERLLARKHPITVGVFEDQPMEEVNTIADECGLDLIQLSGNERWSDCLMANRQVIKAVDVPPDVTPEEVVAGLEAGSAIAVMLDISRGQGIQLDREIAVEVALALPVWLAGGLTPENVSDVIRDVRPWAVDVSTGVETGGAKDAAKIYRFVESARMAMTA
jgi:phosphoribosylanthranilate isomerase